MPGHARSRAVAVLLSSILLSTLSFSVQAQIRFNLPAQPLSQALTAVGSLTNLNIYFDAPTVDGIQAPELKAELSAEEALARLLAGTRLHAVRVDENTVRIVAGTDSKHAQGVREPLTGPRSSPSTIHLASMAAANSDGAGNASEAADAGDRRRAEAADPIEQVIVTAEKRTERLQDVPVPVTAISAHILTDTNQVRIKDYYSSVPGFSFSPAPGASASQMLAIRGISTGSGTNPTVGVTVDDVPYGSSTALAGSIVPDIDPSDLARIEVLRGPQGTLYGASSMGGLLKFVTLDPSVNGVSGQIQAGVNGVSNGAQVGYGARGSVNLPISDSIAVRVSAFTRQDPGYIDNPVLNIDGVNEDTVSGGHFSALWKPSDAFSVKLSALLQEIHGYGSNDVDILPTLHDLQQSYIRNTGQYDRKALVYSANVNADLGIAKLTAVSGYNQNEWNNSFDSTYSYGKYSQRFFQVLGVPVVTNGTTDKFTQEVRLSIPLGRHFEWLIGGFYTHENSPYVENLMAEDPTTGEIRGDLLKVSVPSTYKEYAAFTDVTFHVTDQFDVQIGGRESQIRQTSEQETQSGALEGSKGTVITPAVSSRGNAFTYLVTPRFRLSSDFMAYARFASGYRAGGPNAFNPDPEVPREYAPDKTRNYEIGVKADFLDHVLSVDTSLYYIDWKAIQVTVQDPRNSFTYTSNGGEAKSEGVEVSLELRPLRGLTVATWLTYDDAVLTQNFPQGGPSAIHGVDGDRLPYSTRFSGNFSVDDEFPISGTLSGFAGATLAYIGDRLGTFTTVASPGRQRYPSYTKTDLRAGVKSDPWIANVYVTNLANQRGVLGGGLGTYPSYAFAYIQPRTFGLTVSRTF